MNQFDQNKEFYNQPVNLSPEQVAQPNLVLSEFFEDFHLYECRSLLHDWLVAALTTPNSQFSEADKRNEISVFAEKLEELLEAASVIVKGKL